MADDNEQFEHMVFAPGAFDRSKGKTVPLKVEGGDEVHEVVVRDVTVTDGAVLMDLNVPAGLLGDCGTEYFSIDAPPLAECDKCHRKTWAPSEVGQEDRMTQPDGRACGGRFGTPRG